MMERRALGPFTAGCDDWSFCAVAILKTRRREGEGLSTDGGEAATTACDDSRNQLAGLSRRSRGRKMFGGRDACDVNAQGLAGGTADFRRLGADPRQFVRSPHYGEPTG
jgi:hypothetical protein